MIRRLFKYLTLLDDDVPEESRQLECDGWAVLRSVFSPGEVDAITAEVEHVFEAYPEERFRDDRAEFRYEMLNRSARCQQALGHPRILEVIEPLLGDDCHVIANTAWWNPPDFAGGPWHCDAGPHVPRPEGVPWDDRIPYPVFAIGAHLMLRDCSRDDGPTAVVPGSHRSGRLPPFEHLFDEELSCDGRPSISLEASAGDVVLFVSDMWHRGLPATAAGRGRLFVQVHYGRRDIAPRIRAPEAVHQLSPEAVARAHTERDRTLVGLHEPFFYDA